MTTPTRTQPAWRLPAAALISLLLHLVALATLMGGAAPDARLDLAGVLDRPEAEPTPLGLDRSRTVSVAWLGFETPTAHQAPRSAVEQSRLEVNPGRQGGPSASPQQIVQAAAASAQQARQAANAAASAIEALLARSAEAIRLTQRQAELAEQIESPPSAPSQPAPTAESEQADAGAAAEGEGDESEKEADATSLSDPIEVKLGRVASGEGLEIATQRPRFTTLVRRTAQPRNPLVDIQFGRDGLVREASFRPGEGTGVADVDQPLLDAIYAWRARGRRLEALGEDETLTVSIRVLLQ